MYQHKQTNLDCVGVTTECASFEMRDMSRDLTFPNLASFKEVVHGTLNEIWHNPCNLERRYILPS